jgi:hypothetical protein
MAECPHEGFKLSQICFLPTNGSPQWVLLVNHRTNAVNASGMQLVGNNGSYVLPDAVGSVPTDGKVLVYFDGQGVVADDYSFVGDYQAVLHSGAGVINVLGSPVGYCALYHGRAHSWQTILDFVAWGGVPGDAAGDAVVKGLWNSMEVHLWTDPNNPPFGPVAQFATNGCTLDRDLGADAWQVVPPLGTKDLTLACPTPTSPAQGQSVLGSPGQLQFTPVVGAFEYEAQIAEDNQFTTIVRQLRTKDPVVGVVVEPALPKHRPYWWRVRAILRNGAVSSEWSEVFKFIVGHPAVPADPTSSTGTKAGYSVSGKIIDTRITDPLANNGLPGVTVTIGGGSAISDGNGAFSIGGLAPGTYQINVTRSHYTFPPPYFNHHNRPEHHWNPDCGDW